MPGHVHRRQAPPRVGHERHRVNREVLVVKMAAHHPQRELRAGLPCAQAVGRQPAFVAAAGPSTARDPLHRPGIPRDHHVRRAEKGARPSSHPCTVGQCSALRGFAQRCSRKVQARRSPQLLTSCGLHLLGPSERRPNGTSAYQGLAGSHHLTATAQLRNNPGRSSLRPPSRAKEVRSRIPATDPATRPPKSCHWPCNSTPASSARWASIESS